MISSRIQKGFTLVELLFVISIIGLLTSIIMTNLYEARQKAEAVKIVQELKQMEKAFILLMQTENMDSWPDEEYFIGDSTTSSGGSTTKWKDDVSPGAVAHRPPIIDILSTGNPLSDKLKEFLPSAPSTPYGTFYIYDADKDDGQMDLNCSSDPWHYGVNLGIEEMNLEMAQRVKEIIDGELSSSPDCSGGLVDYSSMSASEYDSSEVLMFYRMSITEAYQ